jgi:hypothetical protein
VEPARASRQDVGCVQGLRARDRKAVGYGGRRDTEGVGAVGYGEFADVDGGEVGVYWRCSASIHSSYVS